MTKSVRIENADTSNWPVRVTAQVKDAEGNWVNDSLSPVQLDYPTSIATFGIHSGRRLVIEERGADAPAVS